MSEHRCTPGVVEAGFGVPEPHRGAEGGMVYGPDATAAGIPMTVRRLGTSQDGCPIVSVNGAQPEYLIPVEKLRAWGSREPTVADRLRALAAADVTAAMHGSRVEKAAARAAARAYRLAAEMVEEGLGSHNIEEQS